MFLTYVIKVDKREVLRLYFEHIQVLLLFLVFKKNYPYAVKVNNFGSYPLFDPLDQANLLLSVFSRKIICTYEVNNFWSQYISDPLDQASLICFGDISLKLVKQKYLDNILSISGCFCYL